MKTFIHLVILGIVAAAANSCAAPGNNRPSDSSPAHPEIASRAVNQLGINLLKSAANPRENTLLSPYSIQSALAMTYAGAAGETRAEMAKVLHYPAEDEELASSFADVRSRLEAMVAASEAQAKRAQEFGQTNQPITLTLANRLFGQTGYDFREAFLKVTKDAYGAPFQPVDFGANPSGATDLINTWVADQTKQRIQNLIPPDALNKDSRLVLVNAIYLKVPWAEPFQESATKPEPFHVKGGDPVPVPTMIQKERLGYRHEDDFSVVTLPYAGGDLQFIVLLPDAVDGLPNMETKLTTERLASFARVPSADVILHLPKFKMEPPVMRLGETLQAQGMKSAFDKPQGSADFDRVAPRRPNDYLYISDVFHKTFLDIDEKGTEAAAATAVAMMRATSIELRPKQPVEVKVDRPFLFAIQQRSTGACLFLGRMVDPR